MSASSKWGRSRERRPSSCSRFRACTMASAISTRRATAGVESRARLCRCTRARAPCKRAKPCRIATALLRITRWKRTSTTLPQATNWDRAVSKASTIPLRSRRVRITCAYLTRGPRFLRPRTCSFLKLTPRSRFILSTLIPLGRPTALRRPRRGRPRRVRASSGQLRTLLTTASTRLSSCGRTQTAAAWSRLPVRTAVSAAEAPATACCLRHRP